MYTTTTMTNRDLKKLPNTISLLYSSELSSYYRNLWGDNASLQHKDLPEMMWSDITSTTFLDRIYTTQQYMTKLVVKNTQPALIARTLTDITDEPLQDVDSRPLIMFEHGGDTLQWGLWCYMHNILPLVAETNIKVSILSAVAYDVNTLICDSASLASILPELQARGILEKLTSIHIVDTIFDISRIKTLTPSVYLYLALPECGIVAHGAIHTLHSLTWTPAANAHLEVSNKKLVVSKVDILPMPFLRYCTNVAISAPEKDPSGYLTSFQTTH